MELDHTLAAGSETLPTAPAHAKTWMLGRADAPAQRDLEPGTVLGRYVLLSRLGAGAMGVVYAAHDPELDRKVALKLLPPGEADDAGGRTRLLREAQALAKLSHPHVVAIHDVGTHADQVWIAMEFVAGETLSAWARGRERAWPEVLRVLLQAAGGVAAAHAAGLVHRDLKPDNVMLGDDGRVRVMDFGLAHGRASAAAKVAVDATRAADPDADLLGAVDVTQTSGVGATFGADERTHAPGVSATQLAGPDRSDRPMRPGRPGADALAQQLTRAGALLGTPAYMAPEQWQGLEARAAADQFAWCVMAWELLHGQRPFRGDNLAALATAVITGKREPPPRGRRVPAWLRRALERGMAGTPSQRWPSMAALIEALERGRTRARVRTAALVLAGVAGLGVGVGVYHRHQHAQQIDACAAAAAEIDEVWDDAARQRVRDALVAAAVDQPAATADRLQPWLDRQASAWRAARGEACVRADIERRWDGDTLERALWCLDDRRAELHALTRALERDTTQVIREALPAAAGLPDPAACVDEVALRRQPAPPVADRAQVRAVRDELSQAVILALGGRLEAGLAGATRAREHAQALQWPPLVAMTRIREGSLLREKGAYADAEASLATAYFEAAEFDAWEPAAEAAIGLVAIVGYHLARRDEGLRWAQHASLAIAHTGDPGGLREAERRERVAVLHMVAGEHAEATKLLEQALQIQEQALGPDHPRLAKILNSLGGVRYSAGENAEAKALFERARAIRERALGSLHPQNASILNNLAGVHVARGELEAAKALFLRVLTIDERALGPEHPSVAIDLTNLTGVHNQLEESAAARAFGERALAIQERVLPPGHPHLAATLHNLAAANQHLGALVEARAQHERALAIREQALGPDHPDVGLSLRGLGDVLVSSGDLVGAKPYYERALALAEAGLGPDHADVAASLASLARLDVKTRDLRAALPLLERSVAIYGAGETRTRAEALTRFLLAKVLLALGEDRSRALAEAAKARDQARVHGPEGVKEAEAIEAWLADPTPPDPDSKSPTL